MVKVYIASPYTKGDTAVNVKRQLDAVDELMDAGFAPFAPLYSHFQGHRGCLNLDAFWPCLLKWLKNIFMVLSITAVFEYILINLLISRLEK